MKFNFKKITSIIACTALLGSTLGFAAAVNYPEPFVTGGAADVAIVYGSNPLTAATDISAAATIGNSLTPLITSTGGAVSGEGDKVKIEKGSNKLNLGVEVGTGDGIWGTAITKIDLPTLLGDGKFYNKQNLEYKYEQKITPGALNFTQFADTDYENKLPTLGIKLASNTFVANYTLDFVTDPVSVATSGELTDLENRKITIMGKEYTILDFKNTSNGKLILLDSASSDILSEGETKTLIVGEKSYEVTLDTTQGGFISTDEVVLVVNGVATEKMSATGTTYGNTYKLLDGTYIGVKDINVQNYAGGSKTVAFSIGKGRLEINGGQGSVKINENLIDDLYGHFTFGTSSNSATWQLLVMEWKISDENFLTPGKELVMPGFEAIKFIMETPTIPKPEITKVDASGQSVTLKTTIKDGAVNIPILYIEDNSSTGNYTCIGGSNTGRLATSATSDLLFYKEETSGAQWDGFVVSYASSRDAESYYLKVASVTQDNSAGRNITTISNKLTGDTWSDRKAGDTITLGNVVLTIDKVEYTPGGNRTVNFTINSGSNFSLLYTKAGLKIWLPWTNSSLCNLGGVNSGAKGSFNVTIQNSWVLHMQEKDKDGTIANGNTFNMTLDDAASGSTYYTSVATLAGMPTIAGATAFETPKTGSKVWESYIWSETGTKLTHDKTSTSPAQYSVDVESHDGEMYGNLYIAAPSVSTSGTTTVTTITDVEAAVSGAGKNLIVVGGSCINTVAAELLGSSTALCGTDFSAAANNVGAGEFLIKTFDRAGKLATLVAGYDAADTVNAANALTLPGAVVEITAGKAYKGSTAATLTAL